MITFKKINLNRSYCFFNDIKNIDLNLLSLQKICMTNSDAVVYSIQYIMMQSINNQNIDNEVPLYLSFSDVDAYIIEENRNKSLIFALAKNNKKVFELYKKLWSEIKKQIECNSFETINSGKCNSIELLEYKKDTTKIRLDSYDDDLPLGKVLCFSVLNIIAESVFQIKNKYYPQIHIHESQYLSKL